MKYYKMLYATLQVLILKPPARRSNTSRMFIVYAREHNYTYKAQIKKIRAGLEWMMERMQ